MSLPVIAAKINEATMMLDSFILITVKKSRRRLAGRPFFSSNSIATGFTVNTDSLYYLCRAILGRHLEKVNGHIIIYHTQRNAIFLFLYALSSPPFRNYFTTFQSMGSPTYATIQEKQLTHTFLPSTYLFFY